MKISKFNKFHKNRSLYENTIMEPVEDVSSEIESGEEDYMDQPAQMGTTTKPQVPTKPMTKPVPPGTTNPNQQPTVTPVKAQSQAQMGTETKPIVPTKPEIVPPGTQKPQTPPSTMPGIKAQSQAQGRYSQAQAQRRMEQPDGDYKSSLGEVSKLLKGSIMNGQNEVVYNGLKIEQASENGHFFVDQVDTKITNPQELKKYLDNMISGRGAQMGRDAASNSQNWKQAQSSQMAQEPKMMQERRSNKKSNKSRINELNENPYLISGGLNVGGSRDERTDKITTLNQKLASMKGQKPGYDTMVNQYTEQTLSTLNSIQDTCVDIETNISRLMSSHGYQTIQTILDRCLNELNKLSSK